MITWKCEWGNAVNRCLRSAEVESDPRVVHGPGPFQIFDGAVAIRNGRFGVEQNPVFEAKSKLLFSCETFFVPYHKCGTAEQGHKRDSETTHTLS